MKPCGAGRRRSARSTPTKSVPSTIRSPTSSTVTATACRHPTIERCEPRRSSCGARSPNWASPRSARGKRPVFARPPVGKLTAPLAVDRNHDLVEMPLVAELRGTPMDLAGVDPAERLCPASHGFVAGSWLTTIPRAASRSSTIRRLSGKRTKSQTACSMTSANDVRREPVATINGCRTRHH